MKKFSTLLIFSLILLNVSFAGAKESIGDVANFNTKYDHEYIDDYDINEYPDDNSFYISDEQVQDMNNTSSDDVNAIEEKTTFDQKVINSGHFSSDTATKTWIPVNRVE